MEAMMPRLVWRVTAAALCCSGCFAVAGCGSSGSTSAPGNGTSSSMSSEAAAASAAACASASAVRGSVEKLGQISVSKDSANQLKADLSDVSDNLSTLASDAGGKWNSQIDSLKSALTNVQTAVTGLTSGSGSVSGVTTALGGVASAATGLLSRTTAACAK